MHNTSETAVTRCTKDKTESTYWQYRKITVSLCWVTDQTFRDLNDSLPNAFKWFWQLIQTAQFIPAFVWEPAACRVQVNVLKTNTTSQEKHEILLTELIFWAESTNNRSYCVSKYCIAISYRHNWHMHWTTTENEIDYLDQISLGTSKTKQM